MLRLASNGLGLLGRGDVHAEIVPRPHQSSRAAFGLAATWSIPWGVAVLDPRCHRGGFRGCRLGVLVLVGVLGSLVFSGLGSAWALNVAQLDTGYCVQNLSGGSD